jgi:hypothetical protein
VTPRFALAQIRAAIDARTFRLPGTTLDIHGVTLDANLAPGTTLDALAGVAIGGHGAFLDVNGKTEVRLAVAALPPLAPVQLFYSDDPEYVQPGDDGVLFRGTVGLDTPSRIIFYHVAVGAPRRISLVLRAPTPTRVERVGAAVGPNPFYGYVGQQTTARFLQVDALQEGELIDLAPDVPYEIPYGTLQPNDLIEAIEDLRVVSGGPVTLALVTSAHSGDLSALADAPELPDDSHQRRGVFTLAGITPAELTYTVGANEPDPIELGNAPEANLLPGGRALAGEYGVARRVFLHLANPTTAAQTVYLDVRTLGGGGATFTILFDGEESALTMPCVDDAVQPHLLRAFTLAPGTTETIAGTYMTDGASSYPIAIGLTATPPPPIAPGACGGTAPSPSPSPTASAQS